VAPVSACTVRTLPTGKHREAIVTGGDPTGRWLVGRSYPKDGSDRPMLVWRDGVLVSETPLGGAEAVLDDITSTGLAVGSSYAPTLPYLINGGKATLLPGGAGLQATAINEAGVIAGHRVADGGADRPVRWPSARKEPVELPMPPGATGVEVISLFEDGTVVGKVTGKDGSEYGWLWLPDGGGRRVAGPNPAQGAALQVQLRSGRGGWVFGRTGEEAWRYDVAADRYDRIPAPMLYGDASNAAGWAALGGVGGREHLWQGPGSRPIELPGPAGWRANPAPMFSTTVLGDDGRTIGGHGSAYDGPNTALVWTCA
jgi:hypothetical protein